MVTENGLKVAEGHSDVVLAIDCLDEGIDVPSAKMAFILIVQQMKSNIFNTGRVLRNLMILKK